MELCNLQSKQNMHTNVQINRINAKTNADVIVIVNRDEDQRIQQGQEVWGGGGKKWGKKLTKQMMNKRFYQHKWRIISPNNCSMPAFNLTAFQRINSNSKRCKKRRR